MATRILSSLSDFRVIRHGMFINDITCFIPKCLKTICLSTIFPNKKTHVFDSACHQIIAFSSPECHFALKSHDITYLFIHLSNNPRAEREINTYITIFLHLLCNIQGKMNA